MRLLKPRILNIVDKLTGKRPKTLLDYSRTNGFERHASSLGGTMSKLFSDHEVKMLLIWAIISPAAALAYLIWKKYPEAKWLAVPLFAISVLQFIGQWGGFYWLLQRFGVVG